MSPSLPAQAAAPPGGRETAWTWFALALRASAAILGVLLLAWEALKLFVFRLVMEADPGLPSRLYEEPSWRDYLEGSRMVSVALVFVLLVALDQHVRWIRRRLRATWDPPAIGTRAILGVHAVLLALVGLWLFSPFFWVGPTAL